MAYYDENGKITIDENAAAIDIKNLKMANSKLNEAEALLNQMRSLSGDFQGRLTEGLQTSCNTMSRAVKKMVSLNQTTADNITRVVNKYRAIDEALKRTIETT